MRPIILAVSFVLALSAAAQQVSVASVYYQVVYTDGKVRDLSRVPKDNKDIDTVTRIASIQYAEGAGMEIWSVTNEAIGTEERAGGATIRTQLEWDNKAWVAPKIVVEVPPAPADNPAPTDAPAPAAKSGDQTPTTPDDAEFIQEIQGACTSLAEQTASANLARKHADENHDKANLALAKKRIVQFAQHRKDLQAARTDDHMRRGVGHVATTQPADMDKKTIGVVKPIDDQVVPGHRVQVWQMPKAKGKRTYNVSMEHAEGGNGGAFYYVAYADSDGDGRPDKVIARSPKATADKGGQWTSWSFDTDAESVFVGNAWANKDATIYARKAQKDDKDLQSINGDMYISDCFGATPQVKTDPYVGNIRVNVKE